MEPIYVARPGGLSWLNAAILGLLVSTISAGLLMLAFVNALSAGVTAVSLLLSAVLIWAILPRRYEVWPDRLRIVFPLWRWDIALDGIATVRAGHWYEAYGFMGWRFAMAPTQTVTVLRSNSNLFTRPNLVISPENRGEFLRQLNQAMSNHARA